MNVRIIKSEYEHELESSVNSKIKQLEGYGYRIVDIKFSCMAMPSYRYYYCAMIMYVEK